jgi:hypothetical protein
MISNLCHIQGIPPSTEWRSSLRGAAIARIVLEQARTDLGQALDQCAIPWLPLKGMGSIGSFYPRPECRPTSDLDVLIPRDRLEEAIQALTTAGWTPIEDDEFEAGAIYNWKATHHTGLMLELHYTLWGGVDPGLTPALLRDAKKAPNLGSHALSSSASDLFIIGASHLWNSPRPRVLLYFLDLHLLSHASAADKKDTDLIADVVRRARDHDLQLFVGLSASITEALWPHPVTATISNNLLADLRLPERALLQLTRSTPSADLHLGAMTLARLLSRRKTRTGWNAAIRFLTRSKIPRPRRLQKSSIREERR